MVIGFVWAFKPARTGSWSLFIFMFLRPLDVLTKYRLLLIFQNNGKIDFTYPFYPTICVFSYMDWFSDDPSSVLKLEY